MFSHSFVNVRKLKLLNFNSLGLTKHPETNETANKNTRLE
ncbi:hypothetical protein CUZ95_2073 [Enterococcus lactis]|nr:hypothetical protein [Enterococcus lactis]